MIVWSFAATLAVGTGLAIHLALTGLLALARRYAGRKRMRPVSGPTVGKKALPSSSDVKERWVAYLPLGASLLAASSLFPWAPILGAYLVGAGFALSRYLLPRDPFGKPRGRRTTEKRIDEQVKELVSEFRSRYQVKPSVFGTLEEVAEGLEEPLRGLIDEAVKSYYVTGSPRQAFLILRSSSDHHPYLCQFIFILERSDKATSEALQEALRDLEERMEQRHRLRGRSRIALALLRGEARFLQGANVAAIGAAAFVPVLREFYTSTVARQGIFMAAVSAVLATSIYFDQEVRMLEERVL